MAILLLIIVGIAVYVVLGKSGQPKTVPGRRTSKKENEDESLLFTDLSDSDDSMHL